MSTTPDDVEALKARVQELEARWDRFEAWIGYHQVSDGVDLWSLQELLGALKISAHASDIWPPPSREAIAKLVNASKHPQ